MNCRTRPIKGFIIFLLVVFFVSVGSIILFSLTKQDIVVAVLVYIFCGAFSAVSLFMLLEQLFHYYEISDGYFINHILFVKKKYRISNISKIILKDEMYIIYRNSNRIAVISSRIVGANEIILALEKYGKHID